MALKHTLQVMNHLTGGEVHGVTLDVRDANIVIKQELSLGGSDSQSIY